MLFKTCWALVAAWWRPAREGAGWQEIDRAWRELYDVLFQRQEND